MASEFGEAYARMLAQDMVLTELAGRTASVALSDGVPPRDVWLAVCASADVPLDRRHGVGKLPEH